MYAIAMFEKKGLLVTVKYLNMSKQFIGQYIVITLLVNYQYQHLV